MKQSGDAQKPDIPVIVTEDAIRSGASSVAIYVRHENVHNRFPESDALWRKYPLLAKHIEDGGGDSNFIACKFDIDPDGREALKLLHSGKSPVGALHAFMGDWRRIMSVLAKYIIEHPDTQLGKTQFVFGATRTAAMDQKAFARLAPGFEILPFDEKEIDMYSHSAIAGNYHARGMPSDKASNLSRSKGLFMVVITRENLLKHYLSA